jgi:rod shape determining protein RodA
VNIDFVRTLRTGGSASPPTRVRFEFLPEPVLIPLLIILMGCGLGVLYSALHGRTEGLSAQGIKLIAGLVVMLIVAHVHPREFLRFGPVLWLGGVFLLVLVHVFGEVAKGGQRWLEVAPLPRFQPSELLKLAVPLTVAWYLHDRSSPPSFRDVCVALAIMGIPVGLIIVQPDLGTGLLVFAAGGSVLFLAGLPWIYPVVAFGAIAAAAPVLWNFLHEYQQKRILTLFDPESDPLGAGWNIIQSTTAIGSGGLTGKGVLQGTQSGLDFLPEAQTDFILAVIGEEFGFVGAMGFLVLYVLIIARTLYVSKIVRRSFDRLVAGSIGVTFFVYVFVNVGMVCGLLPVVGVPLPLVSYGGTSALTLLFTFGVLISIYKHRNH